MMFSVTKRGRHPGFPENSFNVNLIISETVNDSYVLKGEESFILKQRKPCAEINFMQRRHSKRSFMNMKLSFRGNISRSRITGSACRTHNESYFVRVSAFPDPVLSIANKQFMSPTVLKEICY
jgi:hypothetical protein